MNNLFDRVCNLGDNKIEITSLLIEEVEKFKSLALRKKLYSAIATSLEETGDKKKAQEYYEKILNSGDGITFPVRCQLIDRFFSEAKYDQLYPLIEEGLENADISNEMKAEWACIRLTALILQNKIKLKSLCGECKKIESYHFEDEKTPSNVFIDSHPIFGKRNISKKHYSL